MHRMRELVGGFDLTRPPKQDAIHFAVVVTPWLGTNVPWFSLVCGLFLVSSGNKVTFISDDLPFGKHSLRFRFVVGCIRSVLRLIRGRHDIIHLSDHVSSAPLNRAEQQTVDNLAMLNAVWQMRGEMNTVGRQLYTERSIRQLDVSYGAIDSLLHSSRYDAVLVPGGVYGSSGIWVALAKAAGVRVCSFDSGGPGVLLLAADGIASQLQDIPRALRLLKTHTASREEHIFIAESAFAEIARRRSGVDKFDSQIKKTGAMDMRFKGAVLVALNSSWDTASLGLHAVFKSNTEWLVETTKYLLDNTLVPVIVRQHPAERKEIARTSEDYQSLLTVHFGNHPRLHFIAADEPINSYDLLKQIVAIVVHTSTIGIEAAIYGKAVVTSSSSYYSNCSFVCKATTIAQYHCFLSDVVAGRCIVSGEMRDEALYCYYLTQCCNWIITPFSPEGFEQWCRYDLQRIGQCESVKMIVQSLEKNVPISYLNHLRGSTINPTNDENDEFISHSSRVD